VVLEQHGHFAAVNIFLNHVREHVLDARAVILMVLSGCYQNSPRPAFRRTLPCERMVNPPALRKLHASEKFWGREKKCVPIHAIRVFISP
jgi:hypothetical protein